MTDDSGGQFLVVDVALAPMQGSWKTEEFMEPGQASNTLS